MPVGVLVSVFEFRDAFQESSGVFPVEVLAPLAHLRHRFSRRHFSAVSRDCGAESSGGGGGVSGDCVVGGGGDSVNLSDSRRSVTGAELLGVCGDVIAQTIAEIIYRALGV